MAISSQTLRTYQELADWYERQSQAQMRDRFLLLAADTALYEGHPDEAERLRQRLLEHSPHHMLRPFGSFAEALSSPDVQGYISDLRQTYPPETAEQLLRSLRGSATEEEKEATEVPSLPPAAPPIQAPAAAKGPLKVYQVKDEETELLGPSTGRPAPANRPAVTHKPAAAPQAARPIPRPNPALSRKAVAPPTAPPPLAAPLTLNVPPTPRPASPVPARPQQAMHRPQSVLHAPPLPQLVENEETSERSGGWIAVGLFGVVLLAAVMLTVYTFGRPFLPPGWLP